jgi:cytidylate kinase
MVRVITIGREYGSGGRSIARILSTRLGWKLVDDCLIAEIARNVNASADAIRTHEESVDPWFHRVMKALWRGGFEGVVTRADAEAFDADAIAKLWHRVILEAAEIGSCVAVGRGGQCLLQNRRDVFHVYIYAPFNERVQRLREREGAGIDAAAAARERDARRADYLRHHFNCEWTNPHLYQLMLCSSIGLEQAAATILCAAGLAENGR